MGSQAQGKQSTPRGWYSTSPSSLLWGRMWKKEWVSSTTVFMSIFLLSITSFTSSVGWVYNLSVSVFRALWRTRSLKLILPWRRSATQRPSATTTPLASWVKSRWRRAEEVLCCVFHSYGLREHGSVCVSQGKFIRIHFGPSGKLASADIDICESQSSDFPHLKLRPT